MTSKTLKALLATAAIALTGGMATSQAQAANLTPTEVSIVANEGGEFYGYVSSSDDNCESGRKVTLFKMTGKTPNPKADQKIGFDIAQPNGPDSMWNTGNTGQRKGKFYAKVSKASDCAGDISPVVKAKA